MNKDGQCRLARNFINQYVGIENSESGSKAAQEVKLGFKKGMGSGFINQMISCKLHPK